MAFKQATRAGSKALIGIYGGSGSGKTLSALYLARGLVGPAGNVLMLDTESGRGRLYSDDPKIGGYLHDELDAPYSSRRYSEKIKEAIDHHRANGAETCLVIDSFSHEWEGVGGVVNAAETISEQRAEKKGYAWNGQVQFGDWKQPKQDHKRMMLDMLGAPVHLICCLRAQYKSHQIEKKDYEKYGIRSNANTTVLRDDFQTPIQDANFIYEMTVHMELRAPTQDRPNCAGVPILTKCPDMLLAAFGRDERLSVEVGHRIADWCRGGGVESPATAELMKQAKAAAQNGFEAYHEFFTKLDQRDKVILTEQTMPHPDDPSLPDVAVHTALKGIAIKVDKDKEIAE